MSNEEMMSDAELDRHHKAVFETRYGKPSDLVVAFGPLAIWPASVLASCDFDTDYVPTFSEDDTRIYIVRERIGGCLEATGEDRIYGWATAEALCERYTGSNPGAHLRSRGLTYRCCLQQLVMDGQ
jgi:hypothetical protein